MGTSGVVVKCADCRNLVAGIDGRDFSVVYVVKRSAKGLPVILCPKCARAQPGGFYFKEVPTEDEED